MKKLNYSITKLNVGEKFTEILNSCSILICIKLLLATISWFSTNFTTVILFFYFNIKLVRKVRPNDYSDRRSIKNLDSNNRVSLKGLYLSI